MEKKTITINPELFKLGKTKKQKQSKPLVTPKMIKRTLINRIKEQRRKKDKVPNVIKSDSPAEAPKQTDAFKESELFLSNIMNKRVENAGKTHAKAGTFEVGKTIKNHSPLNNYNIEPISKNVENILFKPSGELKYSIDSEVPHGCLKNGLKPCFKSWKNGAHFTHTPPPSTSITYSEKDEVKNTVVSEINKAINAKTEYSTELIEKYKSTEDKPLTILEDIKLDIPDLQPDILNMEYIGQSSQAIFIKQCLERTV